MATEEEQIHVTEEALIEARKTADKLTSAILSDMVIALNETKLKLLLNIKELKQQLNQQKEDQADIYFYLNKKCDDAYEVIATLEEQLLNEQADREITEKMYEKKVKETDSAMQLNDTRQASKIRELEDKLLTLKEFGDKKAEMEKLLSDCVDTLDGERKQFAKTLDDLENKTMRDREKLKLDYSRDLVRAKIDLKSQIEGKLSKATKKTINMNSKLSTELHTQVYKIYATAFFFLLYYLKCVCV